MENTSSLINTLTLLIDSLTQLKSNLLEITHLHSQRQYIKTKQTILRIVKTILSEMDIQCPWDCNQVIKSRELTKHALNCSKIKEQNCLKDYLEDLKKKQKRIEIFSLQDL